MATKLLFQEDSYLKEFDARVTKIDGNKVYLDQTAFHPRPSGGLDADKGKLVKDDVVVNVVDVIEEGDEVAHIVDNPKLLKPGDKVHGVIDWERRYRMMRLHTAAHILSAVLYNKYNALITGGHITPEMARDDFDLSGVEDWKRALQEAVEEANRIAKQCIEVKIYWVSREEAEKIPALTKLAAKSLLPRAKKLRIVEIPGIDLQADGGPHVKNTCEIGTIKIIRMESKGRKRKRIYYTIEP